MNWFHKTRKLFQLSIVLLLLVAMNNLLSAQGCDFSENDSIQVNSSIYNMDADFTQQYALTTSAGQILDIQSNPSFAAQSVGSYSVYALNYKTSDGVSGFTTGSNIDNISSTCFDTTKIEINVCQCSSDCHSTDGTINLAITGSNSDTNYTQSYALTDQSGIILDINTSPPSLNPLFSGKATGNYKIYALNYKTASGINNYSIGNDIALVTGPCYDLGLPICYQICNAMYDFGDLPDTSDSTELGDYQTLLANNGPRHIITPGLSLGDSIDMEVDGLAQGDGIDDDGIIIYPSLNITSGVNFRLPLNYVNTTGDTAHIEGWIDWNGDGDFDDLGEMVIDLDDANGNISNTLEIIVPNNALIGTMLGVRLRISLQDNMTPYGAQPNGEVEDYLLSVNCPIKTCLQITGTIKNGN